jgi:hypothetical protein
VSATRPQNVSNRAGMIAYAQRQYWRGFRAMSVNVSNAFLIFESKVNFYYREFGRASGHQTPPRSEPARFFSIANIAYIAYILPKTTSSTFYKN